MEDRGVLQDRAVLKSLIDVLQKQQNPEGIDWTGWIKFAVGGLVAGLVAWGGISVRVGVLEQHLMDSDKQMVDDRQMLRDSVALLNTAIGKLSDRLDAERDDRLRQEIRRPFLSSRPTPYFPGEIPGATSGK